MKKEFKLDDEDFNRIAEISANEQPVVQIYDGRVVKAGKQMRADSFWDSISAKYGFDPSTVETNLPGKNANCFIAYPAKHPKFDSTFCKLCKHFFNLSAIGCTRSAEEDCEWSKNNKK